MPKRSKIFTARWSQGKISYARKQHKTLLCLSCICNFKIFRKWILEHFFTILFYMKIHLHKRKICVKRKLVKLIMFMFLYFITYFSYFKFILFCLRSYFIHMLRRHIHAAQKRGYCKYLVKSLYDFPKVKILK